MTTTKTNYNFHGNGITGEGFTIYDVSLDGNHLGLVFNTHRQGWCLYTPGRATAETFYRTRRAAADRAYIVAEAKRAGSVVANALPADPFDGLA